MHWKRRRAKWPLLAVMAFMFILTLAAPQAWRRRGLPDSDEQLAARTAEDARGDADELANDEPDWTTPSLASARPQFSQSTPELPPLSGRAAMIGEPTFASPDQAEPTPIGPTVTSDDYVVVDDPLVERATADESVLPTPKTPPADAGPPSAVAESFARRPGGRSVLVRTIPAPTATPRPAITVQSLVRVRDALLAVVEQARQLELRNVPIRPAPGTAQPARLRVVVESSDDRLAMIPDLADSGPTIDIDAPSPGPNVANPPMFAWGPSDALTPDLAAAMPDLAPAPELTPTPEDEPVEVATVTPALKHRPEALLAQLTALERDSLAGDWADTVLVRLNRLTTEQLSAVPSWQPTIDELRQLAAQGFNDALATPDAAELSAWVRAARSLERRLPIWELVLNPNLAADIERRSATAADETGLLTALREAAAIVADGDGAAWRKYLRLDDLAGLASVGGADHLEARRATARDVLARMSDSQLTQEQQTFLAQDAFASLAREVRPWASGHISFDVLAALIERYELNCTRLDADAIAELRQRMMWSDDPRLMKLGDHINSSYRNGNFRIAVSAEFLNRMIPEQQPMVAPVRDQIQGATIRGRSKTQTQLHLRMLPDPTVWRFGLEVKGIVKAQTYSDTWPARIRNSSRMQYEARKLIMINRHGMHMWPAEAKAFGRNDLVGVDSELDPVPLVGTMVQTVVVEAHRQNRAAAMAEVKAKIRRQAKQRIDSEAGAKLQKVEERYRTALREPLDRFGLLAEPLDMSTTTDRAVMRLRLGDQQQLAAHTPRPSAPSDSCVSLQLHESAMNNAVRGLELDGQRLTVAELDALLTEKMPQRSAVSNADLPTRAIVEFGEHDAVQLRCHDDRVEIVLNIVEMRKGRDSIRNVKVHAFFRPVIEGLDVKLVRDGTLQFEGPHLRTGPRMVLHSVFNKLLRPDQEVPVIAAQLDADPRFLGLMVTQLVIDDGWVAMSFGPVTPDRMAWRTRAAATR